MSAATSPLGQISWADLTVDDAQGVRDFYSASCTSSTNRPVDMGGYEDFCMNAANGETVAGICHAQGENADLPPVWLVYINVQDIEHSIAKCRSLGGKLLSGPRNVGAGISAVIQDPAGAIVALYRSATFA